MIPAHLKVCERELRKAIEHCEYDDVTRRMNELRSAAEQSAPADRQEIADWILTTIEWARLMIVTQRQSWAEEIGQLPQVDRFLDNPGSANQEVCLDL